MQPRRIYADNPRVSAAGAHRTTARTERSDFAAGAFDSALAGIAIVDFAGTILACNDRFVRISGRPESELVGSPFSVLLHPGEARGAEIAFRRFTRGNEEEYETSRRHVRPDDSELLVRVCVRADRGVSPPRVVVVVEDVSADSKLLAAISRREDRFRSMIENATDLITVVDPEGRVLYQSPAATRILGWTPEELASHPAFELVHPDDRERCRRVFAQLLHDGKRVTITYRVRHKDGRWLQVEAIGSNLLDEPSVGGIVINSRDVTDSHLAQERLREAEERYRTLVEQLPLVVYATSASNEGELVYISPQVVDLLGYPLEDWQSGRRLWEQALHPDDRERVIAEIARKRGATDRIRIEYRMRALDGRTVWVIDDMALLRDAAGTPRLYQGFMLDITERETLQEQLRHAQRVDAIGRLAAGIAHDFNNLLMGIIGYSDFAINANAHGDPERVHQDIERIRAAADSAKSLTQQLLAFGRKQLLREQAVNVGAAIAEVEELLRRVIGEDVEVVVDVDPDTGFVNVDPAQFEQLLMNLAINSRDAMPSGGRLTITATAREVAATGERVPPGRYVAIRFTDTGLGMDETTLTQLFEPFFTTKPKGKGTGLGLASAHGFISQSGGDIRVSSTPNRGTEFEILLPAGAPGTAAPATDHRHLPLPAEPRPASARIVLVEDDDIVRALVAQMLALDGHTVHAYSRADEALAEADVISCDVLITDVVMPRTTGVALARQMRERWEDAKVLLMSGYSDESIDAQVLSLPHLSFVQKPFTSAELSEAVNELLRR
jgi:PAS domain S-box-containing protein